jgi:hypothetical protein
MKLSEGPAKSHKHSYCYMLTHRPTKTYWRPLQVNIFYVKSLKYEEYLFLGCDVV